MGQSASSSSSNGGPGGTGREQQQQHENDGLFVDRSFARQQRQQQRRRSSFTEGIQESQMRSSSLLLASTRQQQQQQQQQQQNGGLGGGGGGNEGHLGRRRRASSTDGNGDEAALVNSRRTSTTTSRPALSSLRARSMRTFDQTLSSRSFMATSSVVGSAASAVPAASSSITVDQQPPSSSIMLVSAGAAEERNHSNRSMSSRGSQNTTPIGRPSSSSSSGGRAGVVRSSSGSGSSGGISRLRGLSARNLLGRSSSRRAVVVTGAASSPTASATVAAGTTTTTTTAVAAATAASAVSASAAEEAEEPLPSLVDMEEPHAETSSSLDNISHTTNSQEETQDDTATSSPQRKTTVPTTSPLPPPPTTNTTSLQERTVSERGQESLPSSSSSPERTIPRFTAAVPTVTPPTNDHHHSSRRHNTSNYMMTTTNTTTTTTSSRNSNSADPQHHRASSSTVDYLHAAAARMMPPHSASRHSLGQNSSAVAAAAAAATAGVVADASPGHFTSSSNHDLDRDRQSILLSCYGRRRNSMESYASEDDMEEDEEAEALAAASAFQQQELEFFPPVSRDHEWMGRSIESLILGHLSPAPLLEECSGDMILDLSGMNGGSGGGTNVQYMDPYEAMLRRRSTASTFGGKGFSRRRSSQGSFPGGRRSSLSLSGGGGSIHGGTLANYYHSSNQHLRRLRQQHQSTDVDRTPTSSAGSDARRYSSSSRRGSIATTNAPMYRQPARRNSSIVSHASSENSNSSSRNNNIDINNNNNIGNTATTNAGSGALGPSVLFNIMARESTGKSCFERNIPMTQCLLTMGGSTLLKALDKPAAGMATEVSFLAAAIDAGDWAETQTIISRVAPRLIGDPSNNSNMMPPFGMDANRRSGSTMIDDANLPPTAPRFYAGGGRVGLERDAFILAGGVQVLIRMFREKSFCGQEMAFSNDARDLSPEIVATRLAPCWNETLASLRELVYAIPTVVEDGTVLDNGSFLPFLFTLLAYDACFDGAAALIEEIISLLSQSPTTQPAPQQEEDDGIHAGAIPPGPSYQPAGRSSPATTFFLGNVPDLYKLWNGFTCRQLAHFCRILALLVFEPEDRQLLESPAVLKSLELLQLRRNRAVRAGRDSTVDMNQSILLGDEELTRRLLQLLRVMNYAPSIRRYAPYHVMAQYPFIPDTLSMLGLGELDNWVEVDRQDELARQLLTTRMATTSSNNAANNQTAVGAEAPLLCELGAVADLLEELSDSLSGQSRDQVNQLGLIIRVVSAAQQAGVIVGRSRRENNRGIAVAVANIDDADDMAPGVGVSINVAADFPIDGGPTVEGLASVAGILTDQVLVRRLFQTNGGPGLGDANERRNGLSGELDTSRHFINTPEDAANSLQFNAMMLGPYQVEVLFVLCTLLGGRRKLDAQDLLNELGMIPVLDDMFQRLPWHKRHSAGSVNEQAEGPADRRDDGTGGDPDPQQSNGIHGPGCECTPESALCVQYLRLLHNFCDRDCDNYCGRRLLLSESERRLIFGGGGGGSGSGANNNSNIPEPPVEPGLLSKIIAAFINESDESPYRFWLASCIESYLRGSSSGEQIFAARSGLLAHLIEDVSSERLHCAGSLQTSFDLLGELGKGNAEVFTLLASSLEEESFRKLMSVASANLVDSNVFIRSLLLSLERLSAADQLVPLYLDASIVGTGLGPWSSQTGNATRSYLTHSWWDVRPIPLVGSSVGGENGSDESLDEGRQSDWFPSREILAANEVPGYQAPALPLGLDESVGYFGWLFSPVGATLSAATYLPNSVERLSWFLAANQARLLRDLLGVVDLRNINHENICCLNTAVVIAIFAHRRQQLATLLEELRLMNDEEKETKRRALGVAKSDDVVDRAFLQAMRYLDLEQQQERPSYARITSIATTNTVHQQIGDRTDVMRNFREVLWFWTEYYTHRGRDRLSLEFSSHIQFQEWNHVVSLLAADDGSATALVRSPVRLPRSPYQRSARVAENPLRGF
jgi:Protein of unknown function (DUF3689)